MHAASLLPGLLLCQRMGDRSALADRFPCYNTVFFCSIGSGIHPLVWGSEIGGRTHHFCSSNRAEERSRRGRRKLRTDQSDPNQGQTVRSRDEVLEPLFYYT